MAASSPSPGHVAVFTLGGTIAMARAPERGVGGVAGVFGAVPALTGRQLLDAVPGLAGLGAGIEAARLPAGTRSVPDHR